jgi:hypothetical protein
MSSFKEIVAQDQATFFNVDEFAEWHNVNDKEAAIIIDNDLLKERKSKYAEGTYLGSLLFYIKKEDLGYKPIFNEHMKFDKDIKFVTDVQDEDGCYIITLGENKS